MTDLSILDQPVLAPSFEIWGLTSINVWPAALEKGIGKVPFDPSKGHKRMVYAIDLSILPIAGQDVKPAERSMIQSSKEWKKVQASIIAAGIPASEIGQKWVKIAFEPTGETYINNEGDTKNKTYIHFVKVFASEADCTNDFLSSQFAGAGSTAGSDPNPGVPAAGASEFEAAKKLLEASIRSAVKLVKDPAEVKALVDVKVAASPVMSRFFNADSPELPDMIQAALKG